MSLDSVVYLFREGASPETIRQEFESLTLEQTYGAIAFYLAHQVEVDAYLVQQQQKWQEMERKATPVVR